MLQDKTPSSISRFMPTPSTAGFRLCPVIWSLLLVFFCGGIALPAVADSQVSLASQRRALMMEVGRLHQSEQYDEALAACQSYLDTYPEDVDMLYNRACLENLLGRPQDAVHTLQQAASAGFDDFRRVRADADLAGLDNVPAFGRLLSQNEQQMAQRSEALALSLELDVWSQPQTLSTRQARGQVVDFQGPASTGAENPPQLRVRWRALGLELEVTAGGTWVDLVDENTPAPWSGGPGLVAALVLPDGTSAYESTHTYVFAYGTDKTDAVAGQYAHAAGGWSQMSAEATSFTLDQSRGEVVLRGVIPWQRIRPFHPLIDPVLGLNVALRTTDPVNPLRAAWLNDPAHFDEQTSIRRFIPLTFLTESVSANTFLGKISDSLVADQPVDLDLLAVSATAGRGRLSLDFLDSAGQSLLPDGPSSGRIELTQGANFVQRQADFSGLQSGNYLVKAELEFPDGSSAVWTTPALHLADTWFAELQTRLGALPATEATTLGFLLTDIKTQMSVHVPRSDPAPIAGTVLALTTLLDRWQQTESLLPSAGRLLLVIPVPGHDPVVCSIYVPGGYLNAGGINPVLLLTEKAGLAPPLTGRASRSYEYAGHLQERDPAATESFPVYIIPHLPAHPRDLSPAVAARADSVSLHLATSCVDWALEFFAAQTYAIGGLDNRGPLALAVAADRPENCLAVVVFSGGGLARWSHEATPVWLDRVTDAAASSIPVTWLDFPADRRGLQSAFDLPARLRQAGWNVAAENSLRGGLSLTQTADRLVLWAEDLR